MNSLSSVSQRVAAIFSKYYENREPQRAKNLYAVFLSLVEVAEPKDKRFRVLLDEARLAEIIRSYFLDVIRYKEYHFDPNDEDKSFSKHLARLGLSSIDEVSPLSPEWTELVHVTSNIHSSKVASYTAKWILIYKPISVISPSSEFSKEAVNPLVASINEYYALLCALFALEIKAENVDPKRIDELIYAFRFRKFEESAYFSILSEDYLLGAVSGRRRGNKKTV
jgi:hypothetical protein